MRVAHAKTALPRSLKNHPGLLKAHVVHTATLRLSRHSRLAFWLIVVDKQKNLRKTWRSLKMDDIGKDAQGVVNDLSVVVCDCRSETEKYRREVDPRIFAVVMLNTEDIGTEVIAHEATHVARAYVQRVPTKKSCWTHYGEGHPDEPLCYAVGATAKAIVNELYKAKLLK